MEMKVCTANRFTQSTGRQFAKWNFLQHLMWDFHTNQNLWASTDLVRGYTLLPNRPATLTLQDFQCRLPAGARVKKINVRSSYNKDYAPGFRTTCEPGQPTMSFTGVNLGSQKGVWAGTQVALVENTFDCDLDASVLNNPDFGLIFDFPRNRNNIRGYVTIRNLYLEVYYELPNYELTLNKIKGEYRKDTYEVSATISNKTDTTYTPRVAITIPSGFTLEQWSCKGNITKDDDHHLTWTPSLNRISSDTVVLTLSTAIDWGDTSSYTGTFTLTENYNGTSKSLDVNVQRYHPSSIETLVYPDKATQDEEFEYLIHFTDEEMANIREESATGYVQFKYLDLNGDIQSVSVAEAEWLSTNEYTITMIGETLGTFPIRIGYYTDSTLANYFKESEVDVVPDDEDSRNIGIAMIPVSEEELNRLGHGQVYTAQTWYKTYEGATDSRDWKYNFRLGVFNEGIADNITNYEYYDDDGNLHEIVVDTTDYDNLTIDEIIDNTIWSDPVSNGNNWNNLTCTFRYNKEYPLYIIIAGDNKLASPVRTPRFTEPVISETAYYLGDEPNGIFPIPILNTMDENSTTDMNVPALTTSNTLIFYDFDIDQEFGEDYIVRGVALTGDVDGDNIALASKLYNQGNETRMKSTVIDDLDFTLGGYGDLWGFKTENIKDFDDWEIHLIPSNTIMEDDILFHMNNIRLSLYVDRLENPTVKTYINGEDLDYYGAFLTELKIPEGLKTDTDYLKVNGTDTNDPYMQAIREKEIELHFDLGGACDIYGNTVALRQLTKLLVNERDKYNRPIPKRIEFSHYPDVYWEYIMEDGFTPELDINTYTVKVKLTVPAGTAYTKEEVRTINAGYVDGLTHVNPTILIKPYSSLIQLYDEDSKQHFNLGYTNYSGKSMRIDCGNRKVILIDPDTDTEIDISKYVDRNSDWFRLLGYFNIQATGCIIQNISFKERW